AELLSAALIVPILHETGHNGLLTVRMTCRERVVLESRSAVRNALGRIGWRGHRPLLETRRPASRTERIPGPAPAGVGIVAAASAQRAEDDGDGVARELRSRRGSELSIEFGDGDGPGVFEATFRAGSAIVLKTVLIAAGVVAALAAAFVWSDEIARGDGSAPA